MRCPTSLLGCLFFVAALFAGCEENEDMMRCTITKPYQFRHNDSKICNGEILEFEYFTEFNTPFEIVITEQETQIILQRENHKLRRGEGKLQIVVDIGDYRGPGTVEVLFMSKKLDKLLSNSESWTRRRYSANFCDIEP